MISFLSLDKTDGFFKLPKSDKKTRHELGFLGGMGSRNKPYFRNTVCITPASKYSDKVRQSWDILLGTFSPSFHSIIY